VAAEAMSTEHGFQEVSMFRNITGKLGDLKERRVFSAQYLIVCLVVIIGLALVQRVTAYGERADVPYRSSHTLAGAGVKGRSEMPEQTLSKIYRVAMNSVNADLVLAICLVESNFNPHVESERGAIGLMGIMPDVWLEELKAKGIVREQDDLYAISNNINSGMYVLGRYLAKTNNLRDALSRYAGGDSAYATRVLRTLEEISRARHSEDQPRLAA
jgi:soluble lytic murein transglycosylase-like protein